MPTVYSSVFQNFIRQGFSKSFTHGYAQSVVAATHPHVLNSQNRPTFARRNSQRVGRLQLQGLGLNAAFHTTSQSTLPALDRRHEKLPNHFDERVAIHGGLDAYFEHLQKKDRTEEEEKDWVQFQFQKRLEWKPKPAAILLGGEHRAHAAEGQETAEDGSLPALSAEEAAALAHIDAALEKEIETRKHLEALEEEAQQALLTPNASPADEVRTRTPTPLSAPRTPGSIARTATPPVDPQSQTYADHLTKLSEASRYAEIPAVFEAMLVAGVRPIATAYSALLLSAIQLPAEKSEVVSKALDVYSDMIRRKVSPDSDTYDILVGLLASRSLEAASSKKDLENKRLRFGGMEEPGKFMLMSHELEHAILSEDDRLDHAMQMFQSSVKHGKAGYSPETYHQLISACAQAGRISEMLYLFEHMEANRLVPFAATFPAMITAFANSGDLISAVECYNEYRSLAIAHDAGEHTLRDRLDAHVYASVINAYVISDKINGAMNFYKKIVQKDGANSTDIKDALISHGFVDGLIHRGIYDEALRWAQGIDSQVRPRAMSEIAISAADHGDRQIAMAAFASIPTLREAAVPATALLAMSVRLGDVPAATRYWQVLTSPEMEATISMVEPAAMYAVALIGSGQVAEGLTQSEAMFERIRATATHNGRQVGDEIEEASDFISQYMSNRNLADPREVALAQPVPYAPSQTLPTTPYPPTPVVPVFEDSFDPYAQTTDFKGSSLISDDLEGSHGRRGPRVNDALARFRNMRRAGRHPRYITYAKLISAAARDGKMDLCRDVLEMARTDVPLLPQYAVVRYGWTSILDAMVGACLTLGNRNMAEQYHRELLAMGATPSANTFGLYITTLKESTKTFDEASEAVRIFHRAKAEGVEPSSFLYNALIGKLGKARRIDDCLFFFAEMRALNIKPTSVTYGTIVNALCRVSDEKFAEELFDEMEAMPNYKARPAPYNSMMQFFLTTKRDKSKVLAYYERMKAKGIAPTAHTYKLLVDTHATLEPINMTAAEAVLDMIRSSGLQPEPVHYASLIHARGCVMHDMAGARRIFDSVLRDPSINLNASVFQALFEAMVANHQVADTEAILKQMRSRGIDMTPYIANTLIHGWAADNNITKAKEIYSSVGRDRREPSTYEAMTRAFLAVEDRKGAEGVVAEMLSRGYPSAVVNKVLELLGGRHAEDAGAI
jgi:pentatricopeptide repeat protein